MRHIFCITKDSFYLRSLIRRHITWREEWVPVFLSVFYTARNLSFDGRLHLLQNEKMEKQSVVTDIIRGVA
jgi:hypothetical protein